MVKVVLAVLLSFVFVQWAYGQTFEVKALSEDLQEAVLRDADTGEEWTVRKGDAINEWKVLHITKEYVTIVTPVEGGALATRIPTNVSREPTIQNQ